MGKRYGPRNVGRESWRHRVRVPDGVVVLASGGLDSGVLIGHMARRGRRVFPLFVKAGLVWEKAELHWLRRFLAGLSGQDRRGVEPLKVVSLPMRDVHRDHWSVTGRGTPGWRAADNSVYLPGRNVVLLAKAAVHAAMLGVPRIALGPLKGNPFPDASPKFLKAMQRALSQGLDFPIRVEAPFLTLDKEDLIRRYDDLPLGLTFSCSRPIGHAPCGTCAKCRERILAFAAAGLTNKEVSLR